MFAENGSQSRRGTGERHGRDVDLRKSLEQLDRKMRERPVAAMGVVELSGLGFRHRDQVLHRLHAERRRDDEHAGLAGERRYAAEILQRVVRQARVEHRIDDMPGGYDGQRVAVGWRLCEHAGADRAAGSRPVFDQHLLAQRRRKLLGDRTRQSVGGRPGRERNDDADRLRRKRLGARRERQERENGCEH